MRYSTNLKIPIRSFVILLFSEISFFLISPFNCHLLTVFLLFLFFEYPPISVLIVNVMIAISIGQNTFCLLSDISQFTTKTKKVNIL